MEIQTLSIVVPTPKGCVNKCPFCVSKMSSRSIYANQIEGNKRFVDLYEKDYKDRLSFARENGCNTIILTGDGEPLQNMPFLRYFSHWNDALADKRFRWIELQTTGVMVDDEKLRFLRNTVRVSTISVSVTDLFDSANNADIIGMPPKARVDLDFLTGEIKRYDFNLRISINLTDLFDDISVARIFERLHDLKANQVIFRELYESGESQTVDEWVREHRASRSKMDEINAYVKENGKPLERLPFGQIRYSLSGISTVYDDNCMPQEITSSFRYLILRENCKLYSRWDDEASLIF